MVKKSDDNQWKIEWSDQVKNIADESPAHAEAMRHASELMLKAAQEFQAGIYPTFEAALMAQEGSISVERLNPGEEGSEPKFEIVQKTKKG